MEKGIKKKKALIIWGVAIEHQSQFPVPIAWDSAFKAIVKLQGLNKLYHPV